MAVVSDRGRAGRRLRGASVVSFRMSGVLDVGYARLRLAATRQLRSVERAAPPNEPSDLPSTACTTATRARVPHLSGAPNAARPHGGREGRAAKKTAHARREIIRAAMSVFTEPELRYMVGGQQLGRIATVGADGTPHVVPVALMYNAVRDTIDIGGYGLEGVEKVPRRRSQRASSDRDRRSGEHGPVASAGDRGARAGRGDRPADAADPHLPGADSQLGARIRPQRADGSGNAPELASLL